MYESWPKPGLKSAKVLKNPFVKVFLEVIMDYNNKNKIKNYSAKQGN